MLQLPEFRGRGPGRSRRKRQHRRPNRGDAAQFAYEPLDHVALIEKNDWGDLSRIAQVAGSRMYCLKGRLALLEAKLMAWALERIADAGFAPITVPALAREEAFTAQGQFPGHREETYEIASDDLWLAGTAEVALTSLHSGEIIESDKLPILYAGFSPCFRREAGRAGRDVRGCCESTVLKSSICDLRGGRTVSAQWHAKLLGLAESRLQRSRSRISGRDFDRDMGLASFG